MAETLTAQEIGQAIQKPSESLDAAIYRFINWSKMGLIKPHGEQHPGRGRHKRFTATNLLEALLMQTIIDAFGSSALSARQSVEAIKKMISKPHFDSAKQALVLSRGPGGISIARVKFDGIGKYILESELDAHMVLNLQNILARIPSKED